jgi:GTP pyrophosphokinase
MTRLNNILKKLKKCNNQTDLKLIQKAYNFAEKAHSGQKRLGGQAYITHPIFVANFLANLCFDDKTISAALLHDVCEDTNYGIEDIRKNFDPEVSKLVAGVTKLKGMRAYNEASDVENLRKMFLAMARDIRVVLIRLVDRLHNLKTLNVFSPEKRKRIAKQTIEVYAPLAERLGIGQLKGQLEDLAFPYFLPREYRWVKSKVKEKENERKAYVQKIINYISKMIVKEKINVIEIHGRAKHWYSLYKKLKDNDNNINKIYDLQAVRIILDDIETCYKVLGLIHKEWKPLPGRIKDYIAMPKPNGYQSLHTTVFALDGKIIEIQIKTKAMHEEAEWGIAAHWYYSEKKVKNFSKNKLKWVQQLADWQKELKNREEFAESLKIDVFQNRIFVFTPQGDIFDLPEGVTPVDFAYHIHSEVGNFCVGAKADGKIIPLDHKIKNGSVVEILTSKKSSGPKRDWLTFVKTNLTKNRVRGWLKKQDRSTKLEAGRKSIEDGLRALGKKSFNKLPKENIANLLKIYHYKKIDDLLVAVGEGMITSAQVVKKLFSDEFLIKKSEPAITKIPLLRRVFKKPKIWVSGEKGVSVNLASCCNPIVWEPIVGFITRGRGITVHKKSCPNISKSNKEQLVNVSWGEKKEIYQVPIKIKVIDRIGLLKDIALVASSLRINLISVSAAVTQKKETTIDAILEVNNVSQVMTFFRKVKEIKNILEIERN